MDDRKVTGKLNGHLSAPDERISTWQTVIWREWCRAKDEDYAYYLYNLVKTTALGWKFVAAFSLLGALVGALLGYLFASGMLAALDIRTSIWNLAELSPWILGWVTSMAGGLIGLEASRGFRTWYFWWQGQPTATRLVQALQQAQTLRPDIKEVWVEPLRRLKEAKKSQNDPGQLIAVLNSPNWVDRFVARQLLVAMGGEATEALRALASDKTNPLWQAAIWLLASIEHETANRFAWRAADTHCPYCLANFEARPVNLSWGITFTYYGCRRCGQSREYLHHPQGVVAVLDDSGSEALVQRDGALRVNWLARRDLFDFDQVELIQATDEDIERFAVQVGNDTDSFRASNYKKMRCIIGPKCHVSENTIRILRRMFGKVARISKIDDQKEIAGSDYRELASSVSDSVPEQQNYSLLESGENSLLSS
jgi:hypothetical protein